MNRLAACLGILFCLFGAIDVDATQKDERLTPLFEMLHAAQSPIEARLIEARIWHIWTMSDAGPIDELMLKGMRAMEGSDYPTALEAFNEVIAQAPDFAEGWNKRATLYYLMEDYEASIADINRTLELEPRHFGAVSGLGLVYTALGRYEDAIKVFKKALKINPHLSGAQSNIDSLTKLLNSQKI